MGKQFGFSWAWLNASMIRLFLYLVSDVNSRDKYGRTALMRATELGSTRLVIELLKRKADVNVQDNYGYTALMIVANSDYCNRLKITRTLLDQDANAKLRNAFGIDAVLLAMNEGNYELVELLKRESNSELLK